MRRNARRIRRRQTPRRRSSEPIGALDYLLQPFPQLYTCEVQRLRRLNGQRRSALNRPARRPGQTGRAQRGTKTAAHRGSRRKTSGASSGGDSGGSSGSSSGSGDPDGDRPAARLILLAVCEVIA